MGKKSIQMNRARRLGKGYKSNQGKKGLAYSWNSFTCRNIQRSIRDKKDQEI